MTIQVVRASGMVLVFVAFWFVSAAVTPDGLDGARGFAGAAVFAVGVWALERAANEPRAETHAATVATR
jgi:hypothetical protein